MDKDLYDLIDTKTMRFPLSVQAFNKFNMTTKEELKEKNDFNSNFQIAIQKMRKAGVVFFLQMPATEDSSTIGSILISGLKKKIHSQNLI